MNDIRIIKKKGGGGRDDIVIIVRYLVEKTRGVVSEGWR